MTGIQKVALAGATGNLGPAILEQLLKAGFQVTVLTRKDSTHSFTEAVNVKKVDYDSVDSLADALEGQDALISTISAVALAKQLRLVEAAVKAKVKRFIPSEFGSDTKHPKSSKLPCFADKVAVQEGLANEAANGSLTYTTIHTGPFFDWGLAVGLIAAAKEKSITLYDGGNRPFSTTTLEWIGKAVVGVLRNPEATRNRAVYVRNASLSLKQLKAVAEKVTGTSWKANEVSVDKDVLAPAWAELGKEEPNPSKFVLPFIIATIWGEGYGGDFAGSDNELLGVKEFTEAEIESVVAAATNTI
ncbi:NAD(P)-binding protein [Poronia punctata]|nr:NAD(P)-binding protein [Poronia punctata]